MKNLGKNRLESPLRALAMCLFIAAGCPLPTAFADPIHQLHGTSSWRHEFSGWVFPAEVAGLRRDGPPYQLDGSDNVGVRYVSADGPEVAVELDILVREQTPPLEGGAPFEVAAGADLSGTRVVTADDRGWSVRYRFVRRDWTVLVRAAAPKALPNALRTLDAAVRAMPWASLGSPDRLH